MNRNAAIPGSRRLAILGAYGGFNIGDEIILRAVALKARAAGYRGVINVLGPDAPPASALAADYEPYGLRFVSWRNPAAALAAVTGRDLFIGGGQVIDGAAGAKGPLMQFTLATAARATGGQVTIGGVSTERLSAPSVRRAYALLFRCAHRIVTRDEHSLADVLAIAPSVRAKAQSRADVVFGMRDAFAGGPAAAARTILAYAPHRSPSLTHSRLDESVALLRRVLARLAPGQTLALLAHDVRADFDLGLAREIAAELGDARAAVREFASVDDCIGFYRQVRTVAAARMHPIILGACADAYCVPLEGSRKVRDIAGRLGVAQHTPAGLLALPDSAFDRALGIGSEGPLADGSALDRLQADAREILKPAP